MAATLINQRLVDYISNASYYKPSPLPPIKNSLWKIFEACEEDSTRRAPPNITREHYHRAGQEAFRHGTFVLLLDDSVDKPKDFVKVVQDAVRNPQILQYVASNLDPRLVHQVTKADAGFYVFVGAYWLGQAEGDIAKVIRWLKPIFRPLLAIAVKAWHEHDAITNPAKPETQASEPKASRRKQLPMDLQFLKNARKIQYDPLPDSDSSASGSESSIDIDEASLAPPLQSAEQYWWKAPSPDLYAGDFFDIDHPMYLTPLDPVPPMMDAPAELRHLVATVIFLPSPDAPKVPRPGPTLGRPTSALSPSAFHLALASIFKEMEFAPMSPPSTHGPDPPQTAGSLQSPFTVSTPDLNSEPRTTEDKEQTGPARNPLGPNDPRTPSEADSPKKVAGRVLGFAQ
ncbi:hypothetical protein C8R44DRAFT_983119 [Mycena epipterygia]|nr:hypothetical protein C8R44DRAFT_983119 [Mycena epipterygia]